MSSATGSRLRAAFFVLRCRTLNIFVYSDESGVFDKAHNKYFVFGGLVFLSKDERDIAGRRYINAEKIIRQSGGYSKATELKAATISAKEKGKLYRSMNPYYKFGVIVEQSKVMDTIMADKKSKQRYLDFVLKMGVKKLLKRLIAENVIAPDEVEGMFFFVDEHTTSTNGRYELKESLEEEFKRGMYSHNFTCFFPPLFPKLNQVELDFCNSSTKTLVRAADIIANRIYHYAMNGLKFEPFDAKESKILITYMP